MFDPNYVPDYELNEILWGLEDGKMPSVEVLREIIHELNHYRKMEKDLQQLLED